MSDTLTPQQVVAAPQAQPGDRPLALEQIQGDILIGLQKFFERFLFFTIDDVPGFKTLLRDQVAPLITTSEVVQLREFQLRDHKNQRNRDLLPLVGINVGFTGLGIDKLVPGADLGDPSFAKGASARAADPTPVPTPGGPPINPVNDPVDAAGKLTTWRSEFRDSFIDGVFLVTGGTEEAVAQQVQDLLDILGDTVTLVVDQGGATRPELERGHEHFGWLDGVSQPGIKGLSIPFPGQNLLDPGHFVFGYLNSPDPPLPWMVNGSFMVFRRLNQLVPEFDKFVLDTSDALGMDPVLLGARMVGRWKSGAPLALTPSQDDTSLGKDPQQNNDFDFSDDQAQRRCPFSAHIRKTNPRSDISRDNLDPRRIIRAGIPFGDEVSPEEAAAHATGAGVERGLLFVCYQTSILQQFEFLQGTWANNPGFVFGKHRPGTPTPPPAGTPQITVGIDPIIGQAVPPAAARAADEPIPNYPTGNVRSTLNMPQAFIVPTGGGYFFMPSISALTHELT